MRVKVVALPDPIAPSLRLGIWIKERGSPMVAGMGTEEVPVGVSYSRE